MEDLIARVKSISDWEERKLKTFGTEDMAIFDAEAVAHPQPCRTCRVPDGCNDTHVSCRLRTEFGMRADGTPVDTDAPIHKSYQAINAMNVDRVVIPVDQESLF